MARGELLGTLEQIVLLALLRLRANAYGMTVRRESERRTGRNISLGAMYVTLERLEDKGYVSSFTGEPTPERGGRAKRLFRIETAGARAAPLAGNHAQDGNRSEGPMETRMRRPEHARLSSRLLALIVPGKWRIVHGHRSFHRPEPKKAGA